MVGQMAAHTEVWTHVISVYQFSVSGWKKAKKKLLSMLHVNYVQPGQLLHWQLLHCPKHLNIICDVYIAIILLLYFLHKQSNSSHVIEAEGYLYYMLLLPWWLELSMYREVPAMGRICEDFLVFFCLQSNANMVPNFQVTAASFWFSSARSKSPNPNLFLWKSPITFPIHETWY
jgi:hypothetical protein